MEENKEKTDQPKDQQAEIKKPVAALQPMTLNEKGVVVPKDSTELFRMAKMFLDSKAIPKQFENVSQVAMALQSLNFHGIPASVGLRQMAPINGAIVAFGDLPKAICEKSGEMEYCSEIVYDSEYKIISFENKNLTAVPWGATCYVKRKGRDKIERSFTINEAKTAGLVKNENPWGKYSKRMLQMRARSHALKDAFPDILSGLCQAEYDLNLSENQILENEVSVADEINKTFLTEEKAEEGQGTVIDVQNEALLNMQEAERSSPC